MNEDIGSDPGAPRVRPHPAGAVEDGADRGRDARSPAEIPGRGWRDILLRVKSETDQDNLSIVAAGVAYYAFLAVFPALAALVALYGLLADPADVERQLLAMAGAVPEGVRVLLQEQMQRLVGTAPEKLGFGAIVGIAVALWSAAKGMGALLTALNIAYDERERRGFLKRTFVSLLFTLSAIVMGIVAVGAVIALPALAGPLGLAGVAETALFWLRWPLLGAVSLGLLSVLYRYGPSRRPARWQWVTWGSAVATAAWLGGSALLSWYVSSFGSYDETYGSVAAVAIVLLWLWLTAYAILFGAELNSEIEHQTRRDSTQGPDKPMGRRGAYVADTVGEVP